MTTSTAISLGAVNVAADDPAALAGIWMELLGSTMAGQQDDFVFLEPAVDGGFAMFFQRRSGPRPERSGQHLDLTVPWGTRTAQVARAVTLGATHHWDVLDEVPWVQWSTLSDPEGNLFCLAEHPPSSAAEPPAGVGSESATPSR